MHCNNHLSTEQISSIFAGEIAAAGGTIHETFNDGTRLFTRSVVPRGDDVRRGDKVQGGVAIRASNGQISVHPYTFRLVCKNGAIRAQATESRVIVNADFADPDESESELREAIRCCCAPEAFAASIAEMRTAAADTQIDMLLALVPFLTGLSLPSSRQIVANLLDQIDRRPSGSRYDLMNHVTAAAREIRDPEDKWRLEELGGAIGARLVPTPRPSLSQRRELVPA
jgi:hypothetical protein